MADFVGAYTRHMFDEGKRYITLLHQNGVALVDADMNDGYQMYYRIARNIISSAIGDSSPNTGFKIVGSGATNDFTITGGDGTIEGSGIISKAGHLAYLLNTIAFKDTPTGTGSIQDDRRSLHAKITAVSYASGPNETTITDSSANYVLNELSGRNITPDVETPANSFAVVSNTSTAIVVSGDQTSFASVGNRYRIELSTPTVNRTDGVYLILSLDEIDSVEDTNLLHTLDISREAAIRLRLEQTIFVREDTVTRGELVDYIDSETGKPSGFNKHFVIKLATISRVGLDATITSGMVTDNRVLYNSGHGNLTNNPHAVTLEQARSTNNVVAGVIDMGTNKITNAGTPTIGTDLATKTYVDSITFPTGIIIAWPTASAPANWLLCDGTILNISTYPTLGALLGSTFGGDGITTFATPNLKGKVIAGLDSTDPDFNSIGVASGNKSDSHTHTNTSGTLGAGDHDHGGVTGAGPNQGGFTSGGFSVSRDFHTHSISLSGTHVHSLNPTDSAGSSNGNIQPSLVLNYIIRI